jgi:aryl-alcohol dehydrogenase-like predicted oxidoreductase
VADSRSSEGWAYPERSFAPNADATLAALLEVAQELGRSPAQVAVRWVLEQPAITSAIIGARTVEQAHDNLRAGGWRLPPEALDRLNQVSALPMRYPKSIEATMDERRAAAVKMPSLAG